MDVQQERNFGTALSICANLGDDAHDTLLRTLLSCLSTGRLGMHRNLQLCNYGRCGAAFNIQRACSSQMLNRQAMREMHHNRRLTASFGTSSSEFLKAREV